MKMRKKEKIGLILKRGYRCKHRDIYKKERKDIKNEK
jgi:hypothetical protein